MKQFEAQLAWHRGGQAFTDQRFGGERRPDAAELDDMHHAAHERCYIANSLKAEVVVEAEA